MRKAISGNAQVLHLALRLDALPSGDVTLAVLDSTIGTDLSLRYTASAQKLALRWGAEAAVVASSSFAAGTWYSIDIKASTAASPLSAQWQIDGVNQPSASSAAAATSHGGLLFGSNVTEAPGYTAYFDDIFYSRTLADYPLGDVRILGLRPDGAGTDLNPGNFRNDDDTPIDSTSWGRIDDPTMFGGTDHVKQTIASTSSYLEFTLENTSDTCIMGIQGYAVMGSLGSQGGIFKSSIFDGATERVIYGGSSPCGDCAMPMNAIIPPSGSAWAQSAVNGLVLRIGYGDTASPTPFWRAAMLEYATK